MCFFFKRGMGKLWDSMYYLMGGRGVVNNFKNRTVIAALFLKKEWLLCFTCSLFPLLYWKRTFFQLFIAKSNFLIMLNK